MFSHNSIRYKQLCVLIQTPKMPHRPVTRKVRKKKHDENKKHDRRPDCNSILIKLSDYSSAFDFLAISFSIFAAWTQLDILYRGRPARNAFNLNGPILPKIKFDSLGKY